MGGAIHIRPFREDDAPIISAAFQCAGSIKPLATYQRYAAEVLAGARVCLVATVDEQFAGYVSVNWAPTYPGFVDSQTPEIQDLNVLPDFRGRGVATRLLDQAEEEVARRSNIAGIGVGLHPGYNAAQKLYGTRGYIPDGRGLAYRDRYVQESEQIPVDDGLILHLTKRVRSDSGGLMNESRGGIGNVKNSSILVEMAMGYARSRALCAAARLGVADVLCEGESGVGDLAMACGADPTSLRRLLRALATFGIVCESSPDKFFLTPFGAPLCKTAPDSVWPAVVFWGDLLSDSWSHLTECVRTGTTSFEIMKRDGIVSQWSKDPEANTIFRAVMGAGPAEDYMPLARAWDFSDCRVAADLGGGGGTLILAILKAYPSLQGILVERQESIDQACPRFAAEGLASRCALVAADLCEGVPQGADVYLLKHVLHGYSDDAAAGVLNNCRAVIPDKGRLLIIEFVLPDLFDRVDRDLELRAMSDLNMMAVTGGKERGAAEWTQLLRRSRFQVHRIITVPGETASIIEAAPLN